MSVSRITKAVLISPDGTQSHNIAVFEVPAGPEWQVGGTVTTAGCTTGTFNISGGSISRVGLFDVTGPSNQVEEWSGFAIIVNNPVIAAELEPVTATATQ
jgi:hypothetical protein